MRKLLVFMLLFNAVFASAQGNKSTALFNGNNLDGWTKFLRDQGINKDPLHVFTVENGTIHVTGQEFGYLATAKSYRNFHLSLEFKWGEKKFPPREKEKRDAGICFHADLSSNKIWPKSAECQIQEGDVGDLWLVDSVTTFVDGLQTDPKDYAQVVKIRDGERKHGEWNKVEIKVNEGRFVFLVNGVLVNEGEYLSISSGRILLQSEGAEVYYRNVQIEEI
jgi:hypothetical protein